MAHLDEFGREVLDPTPIAVPLRFKRQSFVDQIQAAVRRELSRVAEEDGYESWEESDDFDCGDDDVMRSPYEIDSDQEFASMYPVERDPEVKASATKDASASGAGEEGGSGGA